MTPTIETYRLALAAEMFKQWLNATVDSHPDALVLIINESGINLPALIDCPLLNISKQSLDFVVDTESRKSYLTTKDIEKNVLPSFASPTMKGLVNIGGRTHRYVRLPKVTLWLKNKDTGVPIVFHPSFSALQPIQPMIGRREKIPIPSIVGLDFLRTQQLSLHVHMAKGLAYLKTGKIAG